MPVKRVRECTGLEHDRIMTIVSGDIFWIHVRDFFFEFFVSDTVFSCSREIGITSPAK